MHVVRKSAGQLNAGERQDLADWEHAELRVAAAQCVADFVARRRQAGFRLEHVGHAKPLDERGERDAAGAFLDVRDRCRVLKSARERLVRRNVRFARAGANREPQPRAGERRARAGGDFARPDQIVDRGGRQDRQIERLTVLDVLPERRGEVEVTASFCCFAFSNRGARSSITAWKPFEDRTVSCVEAATAGCSARAARDGKLGCPAPKVNRARSLR
jgi:hypothetical protein